MRTPLTASLLASSALLVSACGSGSSGATPKDWTSALCGGLSGVVSDQSSISSALKAQGATINTDPARFRDVFATSLGKLAGDFTTARGRLDKVGAPNVNNGDMLQKDVLAALDNGARIFNDAKTKVSSAKPDKTSVIAAVSDAGSALTKGGSTLQDALSKAQKDDVEKKISTAGSNNPECNKLGG